MSYRSAHIAHAQGIDDLTLYNIFPSPASRNAIVCRCTRSPVEQVILEIEMIQHSPILACSLTFQSTDATCIKLRFEVITKDTNKDEVGYETPFDEMHCGPLVSDYTRVTPITNGVGRLFKSLGPLEVLTLDHCDMRPYFAPPSRSPKLRNSRSCTHCAHLMRVLRRLSSDSNELHDAYISAKVHGSDHDDGGGRRVPDPVPPTPEHIPPRSATHWHNESCMIVRTW